MIRALGLFVAVAVASTGCGDNFEPPGLSPDQLLVRLRALPGVTAEEAPTSQADAHYFVLHFTQPIDHNDITRGTFQQEVSLLHRGESLHVPVVIHTSGYSDYTLDHPVELTKLLGANQVSIEHRYFGASRPEPTDWSKLTIAQAAADEHEIITALRLIYGGAFITTGGSKGGMTAVFHRRFYPDDVEGTVAYVAPISFGAPDKRYAKYLDTIGPIPCRQQIRDVATALLSLHREEMCSQAELQTEHVYTRIPVAAAVEAAVVSLEWTFWQYFGSAECGTVPSPTADPHTLFAFLDKISPVSDNDDEKLAFSEAYYYQSYAELGYPDYGAGYLAPYLHYTEEDYAAELPTAEPPYALAAMTDVLDYVDSQGDRLVFIYGEWDPWTGGKFALGNATDSRVLVEPHGTHWAKLASLDLADREDAFTKLRNWTGVTPNLSQLRTGRTFVDELDDSLPPRMPTALLRALAARK